MAEELRLAQEAVNQITGEFTPDDLLGVIFRASASESKQRSSLVGPCVTSPDRHHMAVSPLPHRSRCGHQGLLHDLHHGLVGGFRDFVPGLPLSS